MGLENLFFIELVNKKDGEHDVRGKVRTIGHARSIKEGMGSHSPKKLWSVKKLDFVAFVQLWFVIPYIASVLPLYYHLWSLHQHGRGACSQYCEDTIDFFIVLCSSLSVVSPQKYYWTWGEEQRGVFWWEPFTKRHSLHQVTLPTLSVFLWCIKCVSLMFQVYLFDISRVFS